MTVTVTEARLPGIGVRYSFATSRGARLAVILHTTGARELYVFPDGDHGEPQAVVQLDDEEARQLAAILGGAYERPRIVEDLDLALGELAIEWIQVPPDSPAIGRSLAECAFRAQTGITVIAILREPEPVVDVRPDEVIRKGDTLVTVGKLGQYPAFRRLLSDGPIPPLDERPTG